MSRPTTADGRSPARRRARHRCRWRPGHLTAAQAAVGIAAYQGDDKLGGQQSTLGRGRPVVLNYVAGACAPCTAEMPGFEHAYESSAGRTLFSGLGVGSLTGMASHDDAAMLLRQLGIRYPAGPRCG